MEQEIDGAGDATAAALAALGTRKPTVRNAARHWLAAWLATGVALSQWATAAACGRKSPGFSETMWALVNCGVVRPPAGKRWREIARWGEAVLGEGVDAGRLLALLGPAEVTARNGKVPKAKKEGRAAAVVAACPECGRPVATCKMPRVDERCGHCSALDGDPATRARLDYLRSRAERLLPLFDPAPPYLADEDAEGRVAKRRAGQLRTFHDALNGRR